jgi:hypothetical protein
VGEIIVRLFVCHRGKPGALPPPPAEVGEISSDWWTRAEYFRKCDVTVTHVATIDDDRRDRVAIALR